MSQDNLRPFSGIRSFLFVPGNHPDKLAKVFTMVQTLSFLILRMLVQTR